MASTRELLDCLGRTSLVRLIQSRGLATSRENEERRKTLAHSYHGDVEALIHDLTREELVEIFEKLTFMVGGDEVYLPNPAAYSLDDLRAFAIRGFVGRRVRVAGGFRSASELEEEEGDDAEAFNDAEGSDDAVESAGDDTRSHPFRDLSNEWSRPRMVARLLRQLGRDIPERLRAPRFQELVSELKSLGIQACLADDPACGVLREDAESPGIAAKLRLRLADDRRDVERPARHAEHRAAAARKARETRRESEQAEAVPPITIQAGERPVSQRVSRPSDYNLAVLRLQFLTAVPSVQRRAMPEWPDSYIKAATTGLQLRPQEVALLRAFAAGLCIGTHSPYESIPHLSPILSAGEWEQLLDDFVRLNPFQPEFVQAIVEQMEPVTAPRSEARTWRSAAPQPEDLQEPRRSTDPPTEPLAASTRSTPHSSQPQGTNVRDLGALSGMFDDE